MANRINTFKKALLILSMGGSAFFFLGGMGTNGCVSNQSITTFAESAGNAGVAAFFDGTRGNLGNDYYAIVVDPAVTFFQNMFSGFVRTRVPQDNEFQNLLVD